MTNSSDSGIGVGTYTTNEMFKLLGKQDMMPNVARAIKQQKLEFELAVCKGYEAVLYNQKMISPTPEGRAAAEAKYQANEQEIKRLEKDIAELKAKQLPATAYYNLYGYLDVGYGVRTEKDGKYAYLRKAADLGSREAQYFVSDILGGINDEKTSEMRIKLIDQLRACASGQGLGDASEMLGLRLERISTSIRGFSSGGENGSSLSANILARVFNNTRRKILI
ncbi:hypothetical protein [Rodentibacter pneumotropicus]|uniref:hypothetical protein n=1 Tax=Rodentibacter pneumotropicus TaxID=758 RepID=UPI0026986C7A